MEYIFISKETFDNIINQYLMSLPEKKRDKALVNVELLNKIKLILQNSTNANISDHDENFLNNTLLNQSSNAITILFVDSNAITLPPVDSNSDITLSPVDSNASITLQPIDSNAVITLSSVDSNAITALPLADSNMIITPLLSVEAHIIMRHNIYILYSSEDENFSLKMLF
ncbi:3391_t:CDS:2 [Cetraspora pellucida]|uniref:3391_t:CDS:1 n=1 Tax=Cetraspora pellucida TaxID=1433469 RepID=A0ACA9KKB6_9GLOM|nr:3391_t:CDS:2 [Cetraspora pellucida]